jgi:nicotinamidase-related amidase
MDWADVIPPADLAIYQKAGLGDPQPWGRKPALLVIDVVMSFVGTERRPVIDAIDEFDTSCGQNAWDTLPRMSAVLHAARAAGLPVVFTKGDPDGKAHAGGSVKGEEGESARRRHSTPIADAVAPREGEFVIAKTKASGFFQTPLSSWLVRKGVDSLIVIGTSTSGCVRATVVDGHSHGYPVFVVADACFDRSVFFHKVSLFDMNAKYATVISSADLDRHLAEHAVSA